MICDTIGLTADSYASMYVHGGSEVAEVYGGLNYADPIFYKSQTMTGSAPLYFNAYSEPLTDYTILGNTLQDGTPTPEAPVDVVGCGVRTGNLFDGVYPNIRTDVPEYRSIFVGDGEFTLSTSTDRYGIAANLFFLAGRVTSGATTSTDGVWKGSPRTITSLGGYVTIAYRYYDDEKSDPRFNTAMLNTGSTSLPWEPYGYKLPVTIGNTTTPIYIGSDPLYRIGDYADEVDFGNQRIIRRVNPTTMQPYETPITSTATIPELTAVFGDNTLTVDTAVKPSAVSITGNIKPTGYGQLLDVNDVDIQDMMGGLDYE